MTRVHAPGGYLGHFLFWVLGTSNTRANRDPRDRHPFFPGLKSFIGDDRSSRRCVAWGIFRNPPPPLCGASAPKVPATFLDLGASPQTPGIFKRHESLSSDEVERRGREGCSAPPFSSSDELTELFLSAVASPQSRPPLHPVRSPYKRPDPAQVSFQTKHNISFTPGLG